MVNTSNETEYPINAVSKLTGVSCHALRVWERRYGFPVPHRSASGHRRYGVDQVQMLRRLSELSRSGRPIGELIAGLRSGGLAIDGGPAEAPGGARPSEFMDRMMTGDVNGAIASYERLESALDAEDLIARVIAPALTETGERWFRHKCSDYQERCVSVFLRRKLGGLIDEARRRNTSPGRTTLLGTVQGDRHEGGVMAAHLLLERAGWRVINLGVDLPVSEYARAVEALRPDALALSFVLSRNINKRFHELSQIRTVPVFVGGRSVLNYQGLARRCGLIPVPGPASEAVGLMAHEFDAWAERHRRP